MSAELAVDTLSTYRPSASPISVDMSADTRLALDRHSIATRPTLGRFTTRYIGRVPVKYRSSNGRYNVYRPSVDRYSADISTECLSIYRPIVPVDTTCGKHDDWRRQDPIKHISYTCPQTIQASLTNETPMYAPTETFEIDWYYLNRKFRYKRGQAWPFSRPVVNKPSKRKQLTNNPRFLCDSCW